MPAGGHRTAVPTEPVRQLTVPPQILDRGGTGGSAAIAAERTLEIAHDFDRKTGPTPRAGVRVPTGHTVPELVKRNSCWGKRGYEQRHRHPTNAATEKVRNKRSVPFLRWRTDTR
ncbi:unnamed protein product [Lampetra fluviatilis]